MIPPPLIDLRSDTVTRPTAAMRRAMAEAVVGDDVFGDDPTVIALEERVAGMAGKAAALFVPSGTMGNQIAVKMHTQPADTVVLERESHLFLYEQGGIASLSGALAHIVAGVRGVIAPETFLATLRDEDDHASPVRLVCAENTHNRAGGAIVPLERLRALSAAAREHGVRVHLDGARLWNASVASGIPIREWADTADSVMMSFSKSLGAPIGSILVGDAAFIRGARRVRKRLGGGMRQAGILAAAGLHALDHHVARLVDDHRRARALAAACREVAGVHVPEPDTNIVIVELTHDALDPRVMLESLATRGVGMVSFGRRRLRAVLHLDIDDAAVERAGTEWREVVKGLLSGAGRR